MVKVRGERAGDWEGGLSPTCFDLSPPLESEPSLPNAAQFHQKSQKCGCMVKVMLTKMLSTP